MYIYICAVHTKNKLTLLASFVDYVSIRYIFVYRYVPSYYEGMYLRMNEGMYLRMNEGEVIRYEGTKVRNIKE